MARRTLILRRNLTRPAPEPDLLGFRTYYRTRRALPDGRWEPWEMVTERVAKARQELTDAGLERFEIDTYRTVLPPKYPDCQRTKGAWCSHLRFCDGSGIHDSCTYRSMWGSMEPP